MAKKGCVQVFSQSKYKNCWIKRRRDAYGLVVLYFEIIKYKSTNANEIKIIAATISNVVELGPEE